MVYVVGRGLRNMRSAELVRVAQTIACCGEVSGVGRRREIAQSRMRPALVVVVDPVRDLAPGMIEAEEQALVEKLVAHAPERMRPLKLSQKPFCIGFPDEMPDDSVVLRPGEHSVRGELGPIVRDDHAWLAAPFDQRRQLARHALAGDRGVGDRRQALSCHVVDDVEDPKSPTTGELVVNEIQRPAGIGGRIDEDGARVPTARRRDRRLRTVRPSSR